MKGLFMIGDGGGTLNKTVKKSSLRRQISNSDSVIGKKKLCENLAKSI